MIDIQELGTYYQAVDLIFGTSVKIHVLELQELTDLLTERNKLTGFFEYPFCLTYFKSDKNESKDMNIQLAIQQAILEQNQAVIIDFS